KEFEQWLTLWNWAVIGCDEAHKAKGRNGVTSKALARVCRSAPAANIIMMSGTPMPHSPLDIWAQARALDPTIFGPRYHAFQAKIAVMGGFRNPRTGKGTVPVAWQNLDWMQDQLRRVMFQPTIELDLPPVRHIQVPVDLDPKTRRLYDIVEADIVAMIGAGDINPQNGLVKLLRLQQIASGIAVSETMDDWGEVTKTTTVIGYDKQDAVEEIIESTDKPIVVFCLFRAELDAISIAAGNAGAECAELSGRHDQLSAWLGGDARVLAVQIAAGSEALDFTRAHHCVFFSTGWNMGQYEQALKRCHRPGQDQPVNYYHICATDTVDTRVYETLLKRGDLVRAALESLTTT
ncbi:MAG: DEAD/DEAH box helicase, partial [Planctomycetota bacterium]|nr:DEAD/DEAH box helicase [Planctomycetota bacterium]